MKPSTLQPVSSTERVPLFDVLRGFALLGILLVNFWGEWGTSMPRVDAFVSGMLDLLISGSFYPLYAFLFGLGFAVQMSGGQARGQRVALLYLRRMLALFLIGTAHAVLIWDGDILVSYAVVGLLLIPLHRLPQWAVLGLASALLIAQLNVQTIDVWRGENRSPRAELLRGADTEAREIDRSASRLLRDEGGAAAQGSSWSAYSEAVTVRWAGHGNNVRGFADPWFFVFYDILVYFMIGLLVGRARILHEPTRWRRSLSIALGFGLVAAVWSSLAAPPLGFWQNLTTRAYNISFTLIYVCGIALLFTYSVWAARVLSVFAAAGRLGLSNYLMQSIAMTLLSASYGFGWTPPTTAWVVINLVFFFAVQVPFSHWWIARYHFGPAEWLWRSLTYGRWQPFRLAVPGRSAAPGGSAVG